MFGVFAALLICISSTALTTFVALRAWKHRPARLFVVVVAVLLLLTISSLLRGLAPDLKSAYPLRILSTMLLGAIDLTLLWLLSALFAPQWYSGRRPIRWISLPYVLATLLLTLDLIGHLGLFVSGVRIVNGDYRFTIGAPGGFILLTLFSLSWLPHLGILINAFLRAPHTRLVIGVLLAALLFAITIGEMEASLGGVGLGGMLQILPLVGALAYAVLRTRLIVPLRAALDLTLQAMQEAVVILTPAGQAIYANPAATMLGVPTAASSPAGAGPLLTPRAEVAGLIGRHTALAAPHTQKLTLDERRLEVTLAPIAAPDGRLQGLLLLGRDITELERRSALVEQERARLADLTAELQSANGELQRAKAVADVARHAAEEANQFKTQFLANMSHELRTPLNAIINFTEFLGAKRYGSLTERQQDLQQRVINNAEHLLGLINDILDLAKIEAGRMDLFREPTDLGLMLRGVMSTAIGLTKDKGLELELELPDTLPDVYIDKQRIRQVLLNLLSNAAKFTEQGGITVRAATTDNGCVQIAVRDTGIGIAPEQQSLVFEEFRQVDGELTRQHQGTGLGMPISKRLVELHGGRMWLESTPGAGTTFFFTLPLHQPAAAELSALDPSDEDTQAPMVVVVDDDAASQQILRQHLSSAGYSVRVVSDSRQAVPLIRELQPQLVILDVLMPYKDGWEVLTELRSEPATADIPVALCSIVDDERLGLALGANDYLVKPVRADRLLAIVRRWLGQATRILVIDDDGESRQILRSILEEARYEVHEADNGRSGLAAVQQVSPDLIVLDLMMPELDGFAVLSQLRAQPETAEMPVIVVTAKDLTAAEQAWLQERAQLAIQKCRLAPRELVAQLRHIVRKEAGDADR